MALLNGILYPHSFQWQSYKCNHTVTRSFTLIFFQGYKKLSSNIFDDSANLITLENWLEKKLEPLFNPLADIILNKEDQFWRRIKGASRRYSDTTQSNIKISSKAC